MQNPCCKRRNFDSVTSYYVPKKALNVNVYEMFYPILYLNI